MSWTNHTQSVILISSGIVTTVAASTILAKGLGKVTRSIDRVNANLEDFRGRPADPERGRLAQPGVMDQLSTLNVKSDAHDRGQVEILHRLSDQDTQITQIRGQVFPNGGGSLADKVNSTLAAVKEQTA